MSQVIQAFVRQAMGYLDQTSEETKVKLIKSLLSVTEGKIFVEIERARLTRKLAAIKEANGEISEAADILQEVAVETYGAMAKTEKIAFILEQASDTPAATSSRVLCSDPSKLGTISCGPSFNIGRRVMCCQVERFGVVLSCCIGSAQRS